jgi:hypothetical protein
MLRTFKSRAVRRTFWLIKVVPTWKNFEKRCLKAYCVLLMEHICVQLTVRTVHCLIGYNRPTLCTDYYSFIYYSGFYMFRHLCAIFRERPLSLWACQLNPVHTPHPTSWKLSYDYPSIYTRVYSMVSFSQISHQNAVYMSPPHARYKPRQSYSSHFVTRTMFGEQYR